jgi:putative peptide zinc metalloprotease protein
MTVLHDNALDVVDAPVLRAPDVELLGEYTDEGFSRPQYLLRRPDGQVILVSQVLYLVAAARRHHDRLEEVARVVGEQLGRRDTAADVDHLIGAKLRPAGVLAAYGDRLVVVPPANPSRRLSLRVGAVPPRWQSALTRSLGRLCSLPVAANLLTVLVLVDVWVVSHPAVFLDAWAHVASRLPLVLAVAGLMIASLAFHELGHASACRFGGGRPGPLGVGVRVVWPAVHADVTDAYRLDRRGRLRTDVGGVYFDVVFALALAAGYAATGAQPLLAALVLPQIHALYQLLPLVRLDGYYLLSDLVGVPNLFAYLPAATTTLLPVRGIPRRRASHTLEALTRSATTALRAWVALTVAVVALTVALVAYLAGRALPELWRTTQATTDQLAAAVADGRWVGAANLALQLTPRPSSRSPGRSWSAAP